MSSPSDTAEEIGPAINGRYHLRSPIRRTTLSQDWLAHDQLLDREVTFKELLPELTSDRSFVERFRAQAQATSGLTHPALAAVYDWGRDPNGVGDRPGPTYYLVSEHLTGRTVRELVDRHGPMPIDRALHVLVGVTSALGYAHRAEVIHGGLTPDLVTVSSTGVVKVADTGLELALGPNWQPAEHEAAVALWRAPEQFRGEHPDNRTDIYQIGLLAYYLVTGAAPFPGEITSTIAERHQKVIPPAPTKINPNVPKQFEAIIGKSLAKNPDERFPSINEQRSALIKFRESRNPKSATPRAVVGPPADATAHLAPESVGTTSTNGSSGPSGSSPNDAPIRVSSAVTGAASATPTDDRTQMYSPTQQRVAGARTPVDEIATRTSTGAVREELADESLGAPEGDFAELDKPKSSKALWAMIVVLLAVLAGLLVMLGRQLDLFGEAQPNVVVPNVINKKSADAESILSGAGLNPETQTAPNDRVPADIVFDQSPDAAVSVAKGAKIVIVVSSGTAKPIVPNVVGETVDGAKQKLLARGLSMKVTEQEDDTKAPGTIISQEPQPETEVEALAVVNVVVAQSSGKVEVPDVTGQSAEDARLALSKALFRTTVQTEASATIERGKVIRTDPPAGAKVDRGAPVVIFSSGGNATTVPQLRGLPRAEAELKLTDLGLKADVTTRPVKDQAEDGVVVSQSPAAGASADPGAVVAIRVGVFEAAATTVATTAAPTTAAPATAAPAPSGAGEAPIQPPAPAPAPTPPPEPTAAPAPAATPAPAPAPAPPSTAVVVVTAAPVPAAGNPQTEVTLGQ